MTRIAAISVLLAACALASCSREEGLRCEDSSLYANSTSVPPTRVPDDLTVPDESDALLIPGAPVVDADEPPPEECLEAPPNYFEDEQPG